VRLRAAATLCEVDGGMQLAIPVVRAALRDKDSLTRALVDLNRLRRPERLTLLTEMSQDKEMSVRRAAVEQLATADLTANEKVPLLIKALRDKERKVREQAINSLSDLGPEAKKAVPALLDVADQGPDANSLLFGEATGRTGHSQN
jgi:HEAT repeat protein